MEREAKTKSAAICTGLVFASRSMIIHYQANPTSFYRATMSLSSSTGASGMLTKAATTQPFQALISPTGCRKSRGTENETDACEALFAEQDGAQSSSGNANFETFDQSPAAC